MDTLRTKRMIEHREDIRGLQNFDWNKKINGQTNKVT